MNQKYREQTGEEYVPEECEYYGANELGGFMPDGHGKWINHCYKYDDDPNAERD